MVNWKGEAATWAWEGEGEVPVVLELHRWQLAGMAVEDRHHADLEVVASTVELALRRMADHLQELRQALLL